MAKAYQKASFFGKKVPELDDLHKALQEELSSKGFKAPECFLAGAPVSMWPLDLKPDANGRYDQKEVQAKVWTKPIEEIQTNDWVVSYDDDGMLIPGKVGQTFQNCSKHILDAPVPQFNEQGKPDGTFKSLMVTPGHVTFCAPVEGEDNPFAGKHVPIMDILRSDGALKMLDGTLVRAATGAVIGSHDDKQFWAHIFERAPDGSTRERETKLLRLGTRWIEPDGTSITMREHMDRIGVELIEEGQFKGYTCLKGKGPVTGFEWKFTPSLPKPEDYILQRSALTLEEVYEADEWESVRPQMPAPVAGEAGRSFKRDNTLYAGGATAANDHLPPNIPHSMRNSPNQPTMNRQQRRVLERKQQRANRAKMRNAGKVSKRVAATVH
ncbi:MAG: hypothetical protein AAF035_07975 [Pseudomonadota bacterium]